MLSCVYELEAYATYLQSSPALFAALLQSACDETTTSRILKSLSQEWKMVVKMEAQPDTRATLHALCPHVRFQVYRELHGALYARNYALDESFLDLVGSWYPRFTGSCNIEQLFQAMERGLRQSGASNGASLASLMSMGIRCTSKRLCSSEGSPQDVQITPEDYQGPEVRALKDKVWRPGNASVRNST